MGDRNVISRCLLRKPAPHATRKVTRLPAPVARRREELPAMDGPAFDRLSRAVAGAGTRRRLLVLLSRLPLAGLLAVVGEETGVPARRRKAPHHQAQPHHRHRQPQRHQAHRDQVAHSDACIPTGQHCPSRKPRGKQAHHLSCAHCCQGVSFLDASGKRVCGCQPNGGACTTATATTCCSGFCNGSTCQAAPCSAAIPCPACQSCGNDGLCVPLADGTVCDDGNACTQADACQSGRCVGSDPIVCTAVDQCHGAGVCNPSTGTCSNPA